MKRGARLRGAVERARRRAGASFKAWRLQLRALTWRRDRTVELEREWKRTRTRAALKAWRHSRGLAAKSRARARRLGDGYHRDAARKGRWEKALVAFRKAIRRPYPHLSGDLDCEPRVLRKLEALARDIGRAILITSGTRWPSEQRRLWLNRGSNPFPVAFCCPCQSNHCPRPPDRKGRAADCIIGGAPIQNVVPRATLERHGLTPLIGDEVHVEG